MPHVTAHWYRCLVVQGGIALGLLCGAPSRTNSEAFEPVRQLGALLGLDIYPVRLFGIVLLLITAGSVTRLYQHDDRARGWSVALTAYWSFWAALWAFGIAYGGSWIAPLLALGFAWWCSDHARKPS